MSYSEKSVSFDLAEELNQSDSHISSRETGRDFRSRFRITFSLLFFVARPVSK